MLHGLLRFCRACRRRFIKDAQPNKAGFGAIPAVVLGWRPANWLVVTLGSAGGRAGLLDAPQPEYANDNQAGVEYAQP